MTDTTLIDVLRTLRVGEEIELIAKRDEFGQPTTELHAGSRVVTLDGFVGQRYGRIVAMRRG